MEDWRKLHTSIENWEWYDDPIVKSVFLHFVIKANKEDTTWHGVPIKRGELVTGRIMLAKILGISVQQARRAIQCLKSTNEITSKTTNKFTIISICNYQKYQPKTTSKTTSTSTNKQPTNNQQTTTVLDIKSIEKKKEEYMCDSDFDSFWNDYPRHANKQKAKEKFMKLKKEQLPLMLEAIRKQKCSADWKRDDGKYIPHPSTWINNARWEDEVLPEKLTPQQERERIGDGAFMEKYGSSALAKII